MRNRMLPRLNDQVLTYGGPSLYGNTRPSQFFKDLASGADSLDIVVIGDSNTGSAIAGLWGYHNGFAQAMNELGWLCYGAPIFHTMIEQATDISTGDNIFASNYTYAPTGNLSSGNASGGGTAYSVWTPGTNWARYGSYNVATPQRDNWAYIASGTYSQVYNAITLRSTHPLNSASLTLWHRIRWGGFNSGSGSFTGTTRNDSTNAVIANGSSQSTNNGQSYSFSSYEYSFTPIAANMRHSIFGGSGATGPAAFHSHSVYCKRKGWSVTSHGFFAGADSATINTQVSGAGSTLIQTHLQELRERQIAAGGSGRVLLVTHSGINGNETAANWTACHQAIWSTYKAAWSALGYPASDLAILSFVGVPRNAADDSISGSGGNLIAVRAASIAMASSNPDFTVIDSKSIMPNSRAVSGVGNGRSYYQRTTPAGADIPQHLSGGVYSLPTTRDTSDGYTVMAHEIIRLMVNLP